MTCKGPEEQPAYLCRLGRTPTLLNPSSIEVFSIIHPQLQKYLPHKKWTPDNFETLLPRYSSNGVPHDNRKVIWGSSGLDEGEWYVFSAIILGAIYAACCRSLCPADQDRPSDALDIDLVKENATLWGLA